MNRYERTSGTQRDLVGTCAFTATVLDGVQTRCLAEHGHDRIFSAMWISNHYCCLWDPERGSYVHIEAAGDHWRLYDMISNHFFRVDSQGHQYRFADDASPDWSVRVLVVPHEAHASGPDGEHCFEIKQSSPALRTPSSAPEHSSIGWLL